MNPIFLVIICVVLTAIITSGSASVYFCDIPDQEVLLNNIVDCKPELPALEGFYNAKLSLVVHNSNRPKTVWISKYNKDNRITEVFKTHRHKTPFNKKTFFKANKTIHVKAGEYLTIQHKNKSPFREHLSGYFVLTPISERF